MKILLRNAILFDGVSLSGKETDVSIDGSLIEAIGDADLGRDFDVIHDLSGKILCPGFIDLHCHLRDPGQEWREDLSSGSSAGAAGGFTTLVCMPNTDPPLDSPALVSYVLEKSGRSPVRGSCLQDASAGRERARFWPRWARWPRLVLLSSPMTETP